MDLLRNGNFRNFGYSSRGCPLFRKFKENAVPFATGNFGKFKSVQKFWSNGKRRRLTEFSLSTASLGLKVQAENSIKNTKGKRHWLSVELIRQQFL